MTDNVIINPGIGGANIATDDINGVQYQRVKLIHGNEGINDGDVHIYNPLPVNSIEYAHYKTHEGKYFSGGYFTASLSDTSNLDLLIQINAESMHAQFTISASGDATIALYEGTVASVLGTSVNMSNHNRNSSHTFTGSVYISPTVTSTGNIINGIGYLVGGEKRSATGGNFGFANEFILKPNTKYLLRLTNIAATTIKAAIHLEGYLPGLL